MHSTIRVLALVTGGLATTAATAFAAPPTEACPVLTAAQVSSALGSTVADGSYIMPNFKKTCTWNISAGGAVTLQLQSVDFFNAGIGSLASAERTSISGVGDESYFLGVGLEVRKGSGAFKISVYSKNLTDDQRKAIEKVLAQQALTNF